MIRLHHLSYIILLFLFGSWNKQPTRQQAIVYTTLQPEQYDIFILEENSTVPKRITNHKGMDYNASFSPDNKWIVYTSEHNGNTDLYALQKGKTDEQSIRLTTDKGADDQASFSPDGKQIVFMSTRSGNASIWLMPFNALSPSSKTELQATPLTETKEYGEFNPVFSPDGQQIAFSSNKATIQKFKNKEDVDDTWTDIYVADKNGKVIRQLTDSKAIYGSPCWNQNGTNLHYYKSVHGKIGGIMVMDLASQKSTFVTDTLNYAFSPVINSGNELFYVQRDDSLSTLAQRRITPMKKYFYLVKIDAKGNKKTILKTPSINYYHPKINGQNQILLHGNGPTDGMNKKSNGETFARPETIREITVDNEKILIGGVRGYTPTITADGKEIISTEWVNDFSLYEKSLGSPPIVSCDIEGKNYRPLFQSKNGFAWTPVVTRDKKWIVYSSGARFAGAEQQVDIWKVNYEGTAPVNLTANLPGNNAFPDVSYDGKWIVFRGVRKVNGKENKEIYLMDSEGKNVRQMTHTPETETMPAISPDGRWIAYVRQNPVTHYMNIYVQEIDNPSDKGVPLDAVMDQFDMHPRFSPDGKWIVFVSTRAFMYDEWPLCGFNPQPYGEVFIKKIGSSNPPLQLTHDKWEDGMPSWGYYAQ
jgi:Tol biopolymer transport system component